MRQNNQAAVQVIAMILMALSGAVMGFAIGLLFVGVLR